MSEELSMIHNYGVDVDNRVIYLHSELELVNDEENGIDFRNANRFIKNINYLSSISKDPIVISQCTVGGDWNYGMAIYDAILNCPCEVTIDCYAHSRSMSSIIPQAADYRRIHENCDFMIHYGTTNESGYYKAVKSSVEYTELLNRKMIDIYGRVMMHSEFAYDNNYDLRECKLFIENKMDKHADWWMSAHDAVYYGFMDEVIES